MQTKALRGMGNSRDSLGDLLKSQEQVEAGRKADPFLPLMARIDGNCFSNFTKGLMRPFDVRFVDLMVATTEHLVEKSEAALGYVQSDEISLYWHLDKDQFSNREFWFGGKYQKLTSVLAGSASSFFTGMLPQYLAEKVGQHPAFDARVWNVPDMDHVRKNFLWRYRDAEKNSVPMYARHFFSHSSLQGATSGEMKQRLSDAGHPWEHLPAFFKWGTFVQRQRILVQPDDASLQRIPEPYRPTFPVYRTVVKKLELPPESGFPHSLWDFSQG